jgi:excinuclease ABC subunit A
VRKLLEVLHRLVEQGNTVVVIEHNLDVIKTADWVIDLGPGGGVNGGRIIAEGVPETVAAVKESATGQYLRPILKRASVKPRVVEGAPKRPKRSRKVVEDELTFEAAK